MDSSSSTKFLDVDVKVTNVYYHRKEVLVKFQGQLNTECELDYHILQKEIQQVPKVKDPVAVGKFCLVKDSECGEWYRGKVIQKRHDTYDVHCMDSGKILAVHETLLASPIDELFQLPPKMVYGIFANVLPIEEKWTAKAFNYFSTLIGLQIKGYIQATLPNQMFLLHVPKIAADVVEFRIGKLVDVDTFCLIVEMLTEFPDEPLCKQMPDLLQQKCTRSGTLICDAGIQPNIPPVLRNLQPILSVGAVEKVKISVAVSPSKFYCQLLRQQIELDTLTRDMFSYYESLSRVKLSSCDNFGALCAARQKDGQWQRGVIQQLLSDKVKIWFMDFGNYEAVSSEYILKLPPEFISVPMFSFPCALSCLSDQDETERNAQIEEFKEILLTQQAILAHIDLFNSKEHIYYVTLSKCALTQTSDNLSWENDVDPKYNTEVSCTSGNVQNSKVNLAEKICNTTQQSSYSSNEKVTRLLCSPLTVPYKRAEMKIGSVCVAFAVYVLNPSNFWVHTNDFLDEFEALMKKVADVYDGDEVNDNILENPEPGRLCCARYSKDKYFYRAVIRQIIDNNVDVYFLDFGNTDTVPLFDVKILLPELQGLPALAMCCKLANAFPVEDIWIKKETDFFKTIVVDKPITLHVIAKQKENYIVNVQCMNGSKETDVLRLMIEAGCAEYWEVKQNPFQKTVRSLQQNCSKKNKNREILSKTSIQKNKALIPKTTVENKKLNTHIVTKGNASIFPSWKNMLSNKYEQMFGKTEKVECYKEYRFKPGCVFDVVCCHVISPGSFLCQIQNKLPELNNMMEQIQNFYNTQKRPYESGKLACVVKYSTDGKWYRAIVLKHVSKTETDVIFVDYGNRERVLLKDLQAIHPDFLILECQAFKCCFNSVSESLIFDPYIWTTEICSDFESFVLSSNEQLTCLICALVFKTPDYLYYIVDLKTPFTNLRQFLFESGHVQIYSFECAQSLITPFSLCSFYYSSFNMEVGNEEKVYVSYIYSPTKFYCQLSRNANEMDKILKKISEISPKTSHAIQMNTHSLCIAKYFENGLFYRALASPMESSDFCQVYFVDYGNKQLVAKEELVPIPNSASELMFTPMQAIKCYLSDLKDTEIPSEIKAWFEKNYLEKELKAVIVSKESDGQFGIELYDGELQINGKIKDLLKQKKTLNPNDIKEHLKKHVGNKPYKIELAIEKAKVKSEKNGQHTKAGNDKLPVKYRNEIVIDQQKQASRPAKFPLTIDFSDFVLKKVLRYRYESTLKKTNADTIDQLNEQSKKIKNKSTGLRMLKLNTSGQERSNKTKQKYADLPQLDILLNSKVWGYISYIGNISSFYVHRSEDENKIVQLAGELNRETLVKESEIEAELEKGDVVLADCEGDSCIYRALVRKVLANKFFEVEFIDYGNVETVNSKNIYKIEKCLFSLPRLSIHCFLSKAKCLFSNKNWSTDIDAYFINAVNNQPVMIKFLQQYDQQWEVDIMCHGISISDKLISISDKLIEREILLGLENILSLNFDHNMKQLPTIDSETVSNDPGKKSESQTLCGSIIRPTKIGYQNIKPGQIEIAEISHISSNGNFYVKLTKDAQAMLNLNVLVAQEIEKKCFIATEEIGEGLECLVRSNKHLGWYRSEVIKKYVKEECMLVLFVDLGKYEMVSLHDTHVLNEKIRCIPRNAVLCKWIQIGNLSDLSFERMMEKVKYCEIKIIFFKYLESELIWEVDILIDGILFLEYWNQISNQTKLETHNLLEIDNVSKSLDISIRSNLISWAQFQKNSHYPGFVTSVTDPSNFCIQLEDSFKTLIALFKMLSNLPENLSTMPQECIIPGAICLIKNGPNENWNRVEVSEVLKDSSILILTFIDDEGLSAPLPISDVSKLKIIPENLVTLPRLTYPCSLFGVIPADGKYWNDEAKLTIQEFLGRQGLTFQFKQLHCGLKLEVDVFFEQNNAADVLVASGCALYSKTASFGSASCDDLQLPNSCIIYDPLSIQKISEPQIAINKNKKGPQNSDLQLKCVYLKKSEMNSSKKLHGKKEDSQMTFLHRSKINYGSVPNCNEKLFNQCCDRDQLNQSYSTTVSKASDKLLLDSTNPLDPDSLRKLNTNSQERLKSE